MTGVGSAYRNSFGYYAPDVKDANGNNMVFFAPNLSFDFTLFDFKGLTEAQVNTAWQQEFAAIGKHANQAIYQPAYHDYLLAESTEVNDTAGRTINYKLAPFENLIRTAYQSGTEFVTHEDLQQRIRTFEKSQLFLDKIDANTYKAKVIASNIGKFAIDLNQGKIKSVTNWYAYDDDSVFLPDNGGEYTINLGETPDKVSRIVALPDRSKLLSVVGDGTNLAFSLQGSGKVILEANTPAGKVATVEGATSYRKLADNRIEVEFSIDRLNQGRLVFVDDRNPVVANPVANITAIEDASATTIDLTNVFSDPDLDIVVATIAANTNSNLVTTSITGNTLTLNYAKDGNGSADITLRGSANGKTVDTTFSVNITPVDDAPTVVTPIPAVTVNEGSSRTTIDLANVFGDIDNPVANIVKTIQTNNNSNLVTANITGNTLTLDYSPTLTGTAAIDIRATSGGQTVDTRLDVTVNSVFTNLNGDDNPNTLNGNSGRDRINGLGGNDTINGLDGDDYLIGGNGRDTLNGGNGNDILVGYNSTTGSTSNDVDTLIGGGGADLFVIGDAGGVRYLNNTGAAYTVINDFKSSEGDKIQLKGSSNDYVNVFNALFNNNYIYYRSTTSSGNPRNDLVTVVVNHNVSLNLADTNIFQYV
jgi:Ca2+-binding RTX toxin-like protein